MLIKEKFVDTKYGRVFYLEAGNGQKTIVFIHGWLGWPVMVKQLALKFGQGNFRIIAPYLPGHGLSFPLPHNFTFTDLVVVVDEFLKKLEIRKTDALIGHSLGGAIAWELATADHDTKKLVIMDAFMNYTGRSLLTMIFSVAKDKLKDIVHEWRHEKDAILDEFGVGVRKPQLLSPRKFWDLIKTVKITHTQVKNGLPVLAMWGKSDTVVPLRDYMSILGQSSVKLVTFPGGHYWFEWHRDKMLEAIESFINL